MIPFPGYPLILATLVFAISMNIIASTFMFFLCPFLIAESQTVIKKISPAHSNFGIASFYDIK